MVILGIDTSTIYGNVGLVEDGKPVGEYGFRAGMSQSERLLPVIAYFLEDLGYRKEELDKVVVSRGPGSFTGLRIGISTAKGVCRSLGIPLVGVPSADAYYRRVSFYSGPVVAVMSDRRNLVYYALFRDGEKKLKEKSRPLEEMIEEVSGRADSLLLVGEGVIKHREELEKTGSFVLADGRTNLPSSVQLASMGQELEDEGTQEVEPLYAQRPMAQPNK